jgi:hypothetical protein
MNFNGLRTKIEVHGPVLFKWPPQRCYNHPRRMIVMKELKSYNALNSAVPSIPRRAQNGFGPVCSAILVQLSGGLAKRCARRRLHNWSKFTAMLYATVALVYTGCAGISNPLLSSGPAPRVEDCAMIQRATPTSYVCDGKIYTSIQLDEIRNGQQVQLSETASHGQFPNNVTTPTGNFGNYPKPAAQ